MKLEQLRDLFRERWVRNNCLVGVSGGADGGSGLQKDDSFVATRRNIERFADLFFSSSPRQRDFWLGKLPKFPGSYIEDAYRFLKPCLHGSDAHDSDAVGAPALDRQCWIKGDLCFETLRQAVIEPETRVSIGATPPEHAIGSAVIAAMSTNGTPWLVNGRMELNPGLVAIVGSEGLEKRRWRNPRRWRKRAGRWKGESSFLNRAAEHLEGATVTLEWGDGATTTVPLRAFDEDAWDAPLEEVRYLSQHFVEKLCSAKGLATELRSAIERVVFDNTTEKYKRIRSTS